MGKLTTKGIEAAGEGRHGDGAGLILQATRGKGGETRKRWLWRYRFRGRVREMGLGPFPKISLAAARAKARELAALRDQGKDP
jgi:hypothetical protein